MLTFTIKECQAIFETISELSGSNPENVFAWDGTDDPSDVKLAALAKLYMALGQPVPDEMKNAN